MYFDAHAHYDDERFDEDRDNLISELKDKGVLCIVNSGSDLETSKKSIELAQKYDYIYASVGVHPEMAYDLPDNWLDELRTMAKSPKVVAIGEIGLDYHGEDLDRVKQAEAFKKQLGLALELKLPFVIHDRDAHGDVMDILREAAQKSNNNIKGIMHCFSGSVEMANEIIGMGMSISVGGVVTFKNAKKLMQVVESVPIERILTETDCPYLAPTPFRGQRNDSSYIKYVIEKISEIKNLEIDYVGEQMISNAKSFFGIEV
jgi:TatD DNase family protein